MEAMELAEASFAPDAGERVAALPQRAKMDRQPVKGTLRPVNRLAAPAPVQMDESIPMEPPSPGACAFESWLRFTPNRPARRSERTVSLDGERV